MSEKCDVCGRDDGWHDLRTHAWQGQTQAPLLRSMLDDGSTWNVEPEAHMMSLPMEPAPDPLQAQAEMIVSLTEERDALRAEVERLNDESERLRKGKDEQNHRRVDMEAGVGVCAAGDTDCRPLDLLHLADTLDHRLGTPQPDGEPCEPMSARRWRWLP
jgi:hypothetical protein